MVVIKEVEYCIKRVFEVGVCILFLKLLRIQTLANIYNCSFFF